MKLNARFLVTAAASAVASAVVLSFANPASAAQVNWGSITGRIASPADLYQVGTFVTAVNMGGTQGALPIAGTDIVFNNGALTEAVGGGTVSNSYNAVYYDPTTGDANLDIVLDSHSYVAGNNPGSRARIDLTGLTVGTPYVVQVIGVADIRTCCADRLQTVDDGAGNLSAPLQRGLANFAIGSFTADATTQSLFVSGINDPGLSGLVLRAVPEPGSITALALAAATSLLRRRRKA